MIPRPARSRSWSPRPSLVPPGESAPLAIDDYAFSADRCAALDLHQLQARLAHATPAATTGCSTAASHELRKLGGDAPPASLMHAKFAPTDCRLPTCAPTTSTWKTSATTGSPGSPTRPRPTRSTARSTGSTRKSSACATAFAGAPTATAIAYWQLNTKGVREFPLVNNTDSLYPRIKPDQVSQGGRDERRVPGRCRRRRRAEKRAG